MSAGNGSERFCNERSDGCTSIRGGELDKKVPQAYRAYVEETFLSCDAGDARIFVNVELDIETGLYYYGARYLEPKYSRWLSGDLAIKDYMAGTLAGEGGVYNIVNLSVYHYAGHRAAKR